MPTAVVTGAFSNTGAAVAAELMRRGWTVRTLTNRPPPPATAIPASPLRFDPEFLRRSLAGADAFVNTYWVRFPRGRVTFESAVECSRMLVGAARAAGVARFVQVSVSNPSAESHLGYFRGKAAVERIVRESGLPYAIVRPTLIVGPKDVLTNNIAWFLRRFPVFLLPRGAGHRMQPLLLDEAARILADAVEPGAPAELDAAGPEVVTFGDYVCRLAVAMGLRRRFVPAPHGAVLAAVAAAGAWVGDTVLTREELAGLEQDLLVSREPPRSTRSVFDWLAVHATRFGRAWANDTRVRFDPR